jgi:hypothetical protein
MRSCMTLQVQELLAKGCLHLLAMHNCATVTCPVSPTAASSGCNTAFTVCDSECFRSATCIPGMTAVCSCMACMLHSAPRTASDEH